MRILVTDADHFNGENFMKTTIIICSILSSLPFYALASSNDVKSDAQLIFEALNVEEFNPYPGICGSYSFIKEIGGLKCSRSGIVIPNDKPYYRCDLDSDYNGQLIYESLNVKEFDRYPGIDGSYSYIKAIGNLECSKSGVVVYTPTEPDYVCRLSQN